MEKLPAVQSVIVLLRQRNFVVAAASLLLWCQVTGYIDFRVESNDAHLI
jgi:hypothetical protein